MIKTSSPNTNDVTSPLKILIMGAPGARKTTLGLQFPNVHVLDCDRNMDGPLRFLRSGFKDPNLRVDIAAPAANLSFIYNPIRFNDDGSPRPIWECYDEVLDECKRMANDSKKQYANVKTLFLDSLSHVNEFIIRKVMKMKGSDMAFQTNWWTEFKSYAYSLLVANLEGTNKTILCSAHEIKLVEADKDKITQQRVLGYEPFFQGKVGDTIGAFFTDVWRLEGRPAAGGRVETILQTTRTNYCDTLKNSLGMPAEIIIDNGTNNYIGYKAIEPYLKGRI